MKMSMLLHTQQIREAMAEALEKGEIITGIKKMFRAENDGGGLTILCAADTIKPDDGHLKKGTAGFSVVVILSEPPGTFEILAERLGDEDAIIPSGEEIDPSNILIEFVKLESET